MSSDCFLELLARSREFVTMMLVVTACKYPPSIFSRRAGMVIEESEKKKKWLTMYVALHGKDFPRGRREISAIFRVAPRSPMLQITMSYAAFK
jgi:hypothetical protein